MLVPWYGPGSIALPTGSEWKLNLITAYDNAARPVAQFENKTTNVIASFIIVENKSGKPTAESCREDAMSAIRKGESGPLLSNQTEGEMSDGHGGTFAIASHFTYIDKASHNHDVFAFAGDKKTCAEIHISTVSGKPDEEKRLADALAEFHPDLAYKATWFDYFGMGTALYEQSPMLAAPFFDSSLKGMPADLKDPAFITDRRLATDVVIVALERMGNLKASRTYAQHAIETDPDYPLTYYHLACMDAEQGKAADAKLQLQQAFARKANAIESEPFPDPTRDVSILKLKNDTDFWSFVQTLK
jgi:tetratricopeptide (TPR) repeat protein